MVITESYRDGEAEVNDRMSEQVFTALARDNRLNMAYIEVATWNGAVVLRGAVESEDLRSAAEKAASGVPGVERVENRLLVTPGYPYAEVDGPAGL